ncbi:uncharacterized protein LOC120351463 [Nilaparvata lugens]|uniref:uncharacterized protein LOC120351463 n=1 Tax=Nilaparvata lugens TaxID=108931 RepID=UPI00193D1E8D|nr:uncharacterized protein LOC120351463 [Nilaparvata lugens]
MWRTRRPGSPCCARLSFNANEVNVVDWSRSSQTKIVTGSDLFDTEPGCCGDSSQDLLVLLWRVPDEPTNDESHECYDSDESDESDECSPSQPSYEFAAIQWIEDTKHASNRRCFRACRPLVNKRPAITEMNSPTVNLPNHVIDGTSPLHRCSPHSRKEKENRNWLSSLKKKTPSSLNAKSTPSSHHAKTPSSLNPKSLQIRKSQSTSKKPKACGNLLKFFKAAAKEDTPGATPLPLDSVPEVGNFAESSLMNGVAMMDI